jgi:hypothetical protein
MEDAELLVAWLAGRDVTCPACGYSLRDLRRAVCPECSAPLGLAISSSSMGKGPWIMAVTSTALAMGVDGVVSVLIGLGMVVAPPPPTPAAWMTVSILLLLFLVLTGASASGLVAACRSRRRWPCWTRERQWWMGLATFAAVGGGHGLIGAVLAKWWM